MAILNNETQLQEVKNKLVALAEQKLPNYIVPIFESNYLGKVCFLGSAVFFNYKDSFHLLTAAHVIKDNESILYIPTESGVVPMPATWICDNESDVAFVHLTKPFGDLLKYSFEFISPTEICTNHTQILSYQYITTGYPEDQVSVVDNQINTKPRYYIHKPCPEYVYEFYKLSKPDHYCLDMARSIDAKGIKVKSKTPNGMSGCGLWFVEIGISNRSIKLVPHLIGIMTDLRKGKYHVFFGNNIHKYVTMIDSYFNGEFTEGVIPFK